MENNLNLDQQKEIKIRRDILEKEKIGKLRFFLLKKRQTYRSLEKKSTQDHK